MTNDPDTIKELELEGEPDLYTAIEYELQMAQTNRVIAPEIDTIFLTTNLKYSYLSSSIVKEIAEFNGDIKEFLHPIVVERVKEKLEEMKNV